MKAGSLESTELKKEQIEIKSNSNQKLLSHQMLMILNKKFQYSKNTNIKIKSIYLKKKEHKTDLSKLILNNIIYRIIKNY